MTPAWERGATAPRATMPESNEDRPQSSLWTCSAHTQELVAPWVARPCLPAPLVTTECPLHLLGEVTSSVRCSREGGPVSPLGGADQWRFPRALELRGSHYVSEAGCRTTRDPGTPAQPPSCLQHLGLRPFPVIHPHPGLRVQCWPAGQEGCLLGAPGRVPQGKPQMHWGWQRTLALPPFSLVC